MKFDLVPIPTRPGTVDAIPPQIPSIRLAPTTPPFVFKLSPIPQASNLFELVSTIPSIVVDLVSVPPQTESLKIVPTTPALAIELATVLQGPQGMSGPDIDFFELEFVAIIDGAQSCTCVQTPSPSTRVWINGLRQSSSSFTLSGINVLFPESLNIRIGDLIQVEY